MNEGMEKFLGGSLLAVLVRLVILSVLVGIVLAALGLQPFDVVRAIQTLLDRLYEMGFGAIEKAFGYFITGAIFVLPIWLIARLIGMGRSK